MDATIAATLCAAFAVVDEGLCLLDAQGRVRAANRSWLAMHAQRLEDVVGRDLWEIFPDAPPGLRALHDEARSGKVVDVAAHRVLRDGREAWFRGRIAPVPLAEGTDLLVTAVDITETRRADEERRKAPASEVPRSTEALLRSALDGMTEGCQLIGFDWRYLYVNESVTRHGRQAAEDLLGRSMMEVYPGIETTPLFDQLRRCMVDRVSVRMENEFVYADGSSAWFDIRIQPRPEGLFVLSIDITDRKRDAEALRALRDELAAVVEACKVPIIAADIQGNVLLWSGAAERVFGWSAAEVHGKPPPCVPEDKREEVAAFRRSVPGGGTLDNFVTERCDRDGRRIPMSVSTAPLRGASGEAKGLVVVLFDLTEQETLRRALVESEQRFKATFEVSPIAMLLCRASDRRIVEVNRAFLQLSSLAREAVIGHEGFPLASSPSDFDAFWGGITRHGRMAEAALAFRTGDGKEGEALASGERILVGGEAFVLLIVQDVTERRRAEQALRQAQKTEALGRLAGGVAHDFNNLLSVIRGYASLATDKTNALDPLRDDLLEIEKAGQRATELTTQLLAFSRQQILQPRVIDLNRSLVSMDRMLRRLLGEDIELRTLPDRSLWHVRADSGQVEQIIMNLAVNARDAMPDGGRLTIETANRELDDRHIGRHPAARTGPHVMLAVSDSGSGMDKATQAKIFEPFFTTKEVGKGTGLGLSTVLGIVEQSGGSIDVYSELGVGTTFKVYFPRCDRQPDVARERTTISPGGQAGETILLVEDEAQLRHLVEVILTRKGYKVIAAPNPAEALVVGERFEGKIHLLLTDVVMPGMNGRQLADRLTGSRPDLKVLYMSGYTANVVVQHGSTASGTSAFVQKPITPTILARAVRAALDA
jgi:PAS domain S-box-containing protein